MSRTRFNDGTVRAAAAAVIGARVLAGEQVSRRPAPEEGRPPGWLSELDEDEGLDGLALSLYAELGELVELRIGEPDGGGGPDRDSADRPG